MAEAYVRTGRTYEELLTERLGEHDARAALARWLGPPPRVNYQLGPAYADADGLQITIAVLGHDAARAREPIDVEVETSDGTRLRARRTGAGSVRVATPEVPERVTLDPEHRLWQQTQDEGIDPRFDDVRPPRWRWLLNNIDGLVSVTAREVALRADFTLHRIYDQRHSYDAAIGLSPEGLEGAVGTSYGFGRAVTPLWLSHRVGVRALAQQLRDDVAGSAPSEELGASAFYLHDDRVSPYSSFSGTGWVATAGSYAVRQGGAPWRRYVRFGAGALRIWPLALGQALVTRVRGDAVLGDAPQAALLRLGDRYRGGRGFERDELRGHRRVIASLEQRHNLEADASTDVMGLLTLSRIEGALFADAVWLARDRADGCATGWFYDVGYGLRFVGEWLALSPGAVAIDVGVPLNRCADVGRPPVTIYLAFVQSFLAF
ncbi:MAG: hypothetical protein AAB426_06910, partial [Myxococcota bacterium]